jgi:LuxR family transcriptional regulator, maltose regulon positive regulatory protein
MTRSSAAVGGLLGIRVVPPTIPGGFLRRRRLEDRLDAGVAGPLTVLSAGAGSGKTLVAASWARRRRAVDAGHGGSPVAWLALEGDDNEPTLFFSGVVTALRVSGAVAEGSPLGGLALEHGLTSDGLRTLRQGLTNLAPGTVLVLDDFHVIDHPDILDSLAVLLRHEAPLRLVLITRSDPVLPLHRLRVSGGLHEIRAGDLAFDHPEADEFFRLTGRALPASDVSRLVERTEGWATGLRLAAMFLARDGAPADEFAGDDRAVTEYLLAEVFASQPPRMRDFLLRTSVSDRICGELADLLTGGDHGEQHLEQLERSNAFITSIGPHRRWFRYHPLLRETLLHQLLLEEPVMFRELHGRAARWFAGNGAPIPALRHAAAARNWNLLGELFVTTAGPRILSADRSANKDPRGQNPDEELHRSAAQLTCAAAKLEYVSRYAEIPPVVVRAQRMLAADTTSYRPLTAALIGLWVTAIARPSGDMPLQLATCADALRQLSETEQPFPATDQYRAVALANQGIGLIWTGQATAAQPVLHTALESTDAADMEYTKLGCLGQLALADVILGNLDDARTWAVQSLQLADQRGWTGLTNAAPGYLAMALVHLLRGHPAEAEPLLRQGAVASREPLPGIAIMIAQSLVDVSLDRPQSALRSVREARGAVERLKNPPEFVLGWLRTTEAEALLAAGDAAAIVAAPQRAPAGGPWALRGTVRRARAAMMLGDLAAADSALKVALADADESLAGVEVQLATALVADRLREDDRARRAIEQAVRLAAPDRISLPFLTFDRPRTARLLPRVEPQDPAEKQFLMELDSLTSPTGAPESEPEPLAEPLTDRELGVLRLLPGMLSNSEIADELFISVNTVKVHLKTLYRKLDAANRRSAVRRGLALRLIG